MCILAAALPAGASEYLCRRVSIDDGLSQSNVTALARDHRGFLWIGTRFGLNRYDFSNVDNYYHDPNKPGSIPDNIIQELYVDSQDRLWVAGERRVALYDPHSNSFETVMCGDAPVNGRSFYDEGDGMLVGSAGAIFYYDNATKTMTRLQTKGGSSYYYTKIHYWKPDYYILATRWDGLWLFDRARATITRLPGCPETRIVASCVDSRGRLWVSPYGEGVFSYERDGSRSHVLNTRNSELSNNIVLDITEKDGQIWLATDGGGINVYNPDRQRFTDSDTGRELRSLGSVSRLYVDRHGSVYGGTVREGALTVRSVAIRTFQNGSDRDLRLAAVSTLESDADGRIWVGDDGHGVLVHEEGTSKFTPIPSTASLKVVDIAAYDKSTLIVSTFDRGFFLLDKKTGALRDAPKVLTEYSQNYASKGLAANVVSLSNGTVAIITDHIATYDPATGELTVCPFNPHSSMSPFYNKRGLLLCMTTTSLVEYDTLTGEARTVYRHNGRLSSAAYDGQHTVYMGTETGLTALDMSTGNVRNLNSRGLGHITSLALEGNRLWIGSSNNLFLKELPRDNILSFGRFDGVAANEYIPHASLVTDRYVYMGGVNGVMRIDRRDIGHFYENCSDLTINLADIQIDGLSVYGMIKDDCLDIPTDYNTVRISVVADGDNPVHRQMYRFVIRGPGGESVIETYDNFITINLLNPGETYDILSASIGPNGESAEPHRLVRLAVLAPWYQTWWALTLMAALIVGSLIYSEIHRRRANSRRIASRLEAYRSDSLEKEVAFLVNTNHALRTPLTMIYAPVKLLLEQLREGRPVDIEGELENIYRNTKRMRDVIDMAMELHQVGSMSSETTGTAPQDLGESVRSALEAVKPEIDNKHISVELSIADDMPQQMLVVPDRIKVVLDTLIRNAVSRSADNGSIAVRVSHIDDMLKVDFTDRGPHLDADHLNRMFSYHYAFDESMAAYSLGLAYARSLVETLGGKIGARNNADSDGITVWIELPVGEDANVSRKAKRPVPRTPELPDPEEHVVADIDTSEMTILVVEEDNDLCMFVSSQLGPHCKKVLHAFNGKDAMLMIRQNQPDIVISSVSLPIKSGIELCREIKSNPEYRHIPVILLTTLKEGPILESAYAAGADSYLSKPFDMNVLMMRLRNLLHSRSVMKQRYTDQSLNEIHKRQMPNADESFLLKIERIISDNIEDPEFGVDTLADKMHMSRTVLYGKFKNISGMTIGAYINNFRLDRAKELLRDKSLTINEVSERLGFSSQRYFSTFFKDRTGMTPSVWRANPPEADSTHKPTEHPENES